jgi:hypothetical protein
LRWLICEGENQRGKLIKRPPGEKRKRRLLIIFAFASPQLSEIPTMKTILMISSIIVTSILFVLLAQAPDVQIDYHKHLKLWRAQKSIASAYQNIEEAQASDPIARNSHVVKASKLLRDAAKEVNLAANDGEKQ